MYNGLEHNIEQKQITKTRTKATKLKSDTSCTSINYFNITIIENDEIVNINDTISTIFEVTLFICDNKTDARLLIHIFPSELDDDLIQNVYNSTDLIIIHEIESDLEIQPIPIPYDWTSTEYNPTVHIIESDDNSNNLMVPIIVMIGFSTGIIILLIGIIILLIRIARKREKSNNNITILKNDNDNQQNNIIAVSDIKHAEQSQFIYNGPEGKQTVNNQVETNEHEGAKQSDIISTTKGYETNSGACDV